MRRNRTVEMKGKGVDVMKGNMKRRKRNREKKKKGSER